jgi:hypothetical protein
VKRKIIIIVVVIFFIPFLYPSHKIQEKSTQSYDKKHEEQQKNVPREKPTYDYMSTYLSRNAKPLGLKENLALKELLNQSNIKWVIRSSSKHILE